jgi:hypothetical protein
MRYSKRKSDHKQMSVVMLHATHPLNWQHPDRRQLYLRGVGGCDAGRRCTSIN